MKQGDKYQKTVVRTDGKLDVYDVLEMFSVACPARAHAVKKLLCAGRRGKGDALEDLRGAAEAVARAIELEQQRTPVVRLVAGQIPAVDVPNGTVAEQVAERVAADISP